MGFLLILYLTAIYAWPVFIKSYPCSFFNIKKTLSDDSANDFQGFFFFYFLCFQLLLKDSYIKKIIIILELLHLLL